MASYTSASRTTPVNLRALGPFLRSLLVIDGTVTRFIEAFKMEPVEVLKLAQDRIGLSCDYRWLSTGGNQELLGRRVIIRGRFSRQLYVYALSFVVIDRLPQAVRAGLETEGQGLGQSLEDCGIETRREILWYGREHGVRVQDLPDPSQHEFVSRAYRIIAKGKPIALINERFPLEVDLLPSSD